MVIFPSLFDLQIVLEPEFRPTSLMDMVKFNVRNDRAKHGALISFLAPSHNFWASSSTPPISGISNALMPIRPLFLPNVRHYLTRHISTSFRALQVLEHVTTSSPNTNFPAPPLSPHSPRIEPHYQSQTYNLTTVTMDTDILPVDASRLGKITLQPSSHALVEEWTIEYTEGPDLDRMRRAAEELATTDIPVAFPTETVYGLGADATRSSAVKAIFKAKGRPSDNPLIVHVHDLAQLRGLLRGQKHAIKEEGGTGKEDPIPAIYRPLIQKFWPGPLTIILPNPSNSVLAPEVTAGLSTFGARMPCSILALTLIRLSGVPLAGPSANASTRPSPTTAEHVKVDLDGRIQTIVDGGPCSVGVESTVVDGLSSPPSILRPGGISTEQLRTVPGWENVVVGYKDARENGIKPRAPGMKYRHYSPKATVILYESGAAIPDPKKLLEQAGSRGARGKKVGIIRTKRWRRALGLPVDPEKTKEIQHQENGETNGTSNAEAAHLPEISAKNGDNGQGKLSNLLRSVIQHQIPHPEHIVLKEGLTTPMDLWDVNLGADTEGVARGLFSALRELDRKSVDVIFVEGIDDQAGDDIAAAVMNRLRKAAEIRV
jgi:L-threonylcarbamoyladenylate synthase